MSERLTEFTRSGLTFDVLDDGPADGQPVVLLHGFPERNTCWRDVSPHLHAAGLRTLAPDQRGYSPRARPGRRRDHTITELTDDIAALLDAAGLESAHVVGHDWGAVVAWGLAMRMPDRVRSLTAFSVPHPTCYLTSVVTSRQFFSSWYIFAFQIPGLAERLARSRGGRVEQYLGHIGLDEEELARFRREIVDYGALPGGLAWYRAIPLADPRLLKLRSDVPTTFVWSDDDGAIGPIPARRNHAYAAGDYEFVTLSGVSHWIPTQASEAAAEAILERVLGT